MGGVTETLDLAGAPATPDCAALSGPRDHPEMLRVYRAAHEADGEDACRRSSSST